MWSMTDFASLLPDTWFSETEQLFSSRADEFASADPFPHVVIDSFCPLRLQWHVRERFRCLGQRSGFITRTSTLRSGE